MTKLDHPTRCFETDEEFHAAINAMDTIQEVPVLVGGLPSLHYKGLRYVRAGWEASVVGNDFTFVQHPDLLRDLREGLAELAIRPSGRIRESARGQLWASLHFLNPNYNIAHMVGATDETTSCYLGIVATNSHGAPNACLGLDAMAECSDGTRYIVSDILGSRRVRHVGKLRGNLRALVAEMAQGLPDLGQHIADAKATPLSLEQVDWALRGLGYGPKRRLAIQDRVLGTAWALYDRICRHAHHRALREATAMAQLRAAQSILDPNGLHDLLEKGHHDFLEEVGVAEPLRQQRLQLDEPGQDAAGPQEPPRARVPVPALAG